MYGLSSLKEPPWWTPEIQTSYPFHKYVQDVLRWSVVTKLNEDQKGVAVAMRLGGAAKEIADLIDIGELSGGRMLDIGD